MGKYVNRYSTVYWPKLPRFACVFHSDTSIHTHMFYSSVPVHLSHTPELWLKAVQCFMGSISWQDEVMHGRRCGAWLKWAEPLRHSWETERCLTRIVTCNTLTALWWNVSYDTHVAGMLYLQHPISFYILSCQISNHYHVLLKTEEMGKTNAMCINPRLLKPMRQTFPSLFK